MKRKLLLFCTFFLTAYFGIAQTVSIHNTVGAFSGNAVVGQSNYHAQENIYLDTEIGASNFIGAANAITKIAFSVNSGSTATFPTTISNYKIYMKNVPSTTTVFTTGTYSLTDYTLVYDGSLTFNSTGWNEFLLTTPFARTSGTNLQVLCVRTNNTASSGLSFDCSTGNSSNTSVNNSARRYNSTSVPVENSTTLTATIFRPSIQLIRSFANDASLTGFATIPSSTCFSSNQTIEVILKNTGTAAISASTVPVTIQVTGANSFTQTITSNPSLNAGATATITFSGINLNNAGANNVSVYSTMPGDGTNSNDTVKTVITTASTIATFPSTTGAEASPLIFNYLKNISGTRQLWNLNTAFTTSATGAYKNTDLVDSIYPKTGTKYYLYDNYSGANSLGTRNILYSECYTFPANSGSHVYNMTFWMTQDNSFNTDLDSIYVVASTDKGATWTRVQGFGRVNSSFAIPGWVLRTVDLSAYAGQNLHLGIEGVSAYGNVIGIDDITVNAYNPMPITLTNFAGVANAGKNMLNWSTANETNNKGFELQRSINGKDFSTIGSVASKGDNGNSTTELKYTYTDENPLKGVNYYRLLQLDKDGKESYSKIISLKNQSKNITVSGIYPNPVNEALNFVINSSTKENVTIVITDVVGKQVLRKVVTTNAASQNVTLSVANYNAGTYLVKIVADNTEIIDTQKFIKQ